MHSEASVQDRERTQNQTNKDLDVFSLQKRGFLILEGLSLGKRPITVFCGLKWVELKSTEQTEKFQLSKRKNFLSMAIQRQNRQPQKTESQFMQRVDNHLAEMLRSLGIV